MFGRLQSMTAPITCFTALIDIAEDEQVALFYTPRYYVTISYLYSLLLRYPVQCDELEDFLRGKGAQITSTSETELLPRLQHIIDNCHVVFQHKDISQNGIYNYCAAYE